MIVRQSWSLPLQLFFCLAALSLLIHEANASYGDRLPEFRQCVEVRFPSLPSNTRSQTRSASRRTARMAKQQQFVRIPSPILYLADFPGSPSSSLLLDLPTRMRLHMPTHNHRPTRRSVRAHRPIPWKMAILPLSRHARTILRLLLPPQFPRAPKRPLEDHLEYPSLIHIAQVLRSIGIFWHGELGVQHGLPHKGLQPH